MTQVPDHPRPGRTRRALGIAACLCAGAAGLRAAPAQAAAGDRARVLAVTDAALDAINRGDMTAFTGLMVDEAVTFRVAADRAGYGARSRAEWRAQRPSQAVTERGFDATVHVSGPLAVVWLPYDLYLDGAWSHCGVDTFTLVRVGDQWKIASMAWTIEQPPACRRHPDGPPRP